MKHMQGVDPTPVEAEDQPKEKRYILFDHPIITMIVMFALFVALCNGLILGLSMAGIDVQGEYNQLINAGVLTASALVTALIFRLRFHSTFDGMFEWSSYGLFLVFPALTFVVHNLFEAESMQFLFLKPDETMNPILPCLIMAIAPGVSEEIMFRGIPGANWMRIAKDEGDIWKCAIITSLAFGIVHGANALAGAPIGATIFQVGYATLLGFFLCTVYLRTASIWPTMIVHTLIDFAAFLFMDMEAGGIITEELVIDMDFFVTCGLSVVLVLIALIMLRKSKRQDILQLWNRKWHKTGIVEQNRFNY